MIGVSRLRAAQPYQLVKNFLAFPAYTYSQNQRNCSLSPTCLDVCPPKTETVIGRWRGNSERPKSSVIQDRVRGLVAEVENHRGGRHANPTQQGQDAYPKWFGFSGKRNTRGFFNDLCAVGRAAETKLPPLVGSVA